MYQEVAKFVAIVSSVFKLYFIAAVTLLRELVSRHEKACGLDGYHIGKVAIVTGGGSGIGYHVTKELVKCGVHVIIASRDQAEAEKVINEIHLENQHAKVEYLRLDLSSQASIRQFVTKFKQKNLGLNILINNAGVMLTPYCLTEDGFEQHLGVNYFGHVLLTSLLLDILKKSGQIGQFTRVVNVSSVVHFVGKINFDDLNSSHLYSPHAAYAQSKLALVLFTYSLQKQLDLEGAAVTVNALHPGVVDSGLYDHVNWLFRGIKTVGGRILLKTKRQGADTVLHVAMAPDLEGHGGGYYDNCIKVRSSYMSYDHLLQQQLWTKTCDLLNLDNHLKNMQIHS